MLDKERKLIIKALDNIAGAAWFTECHDDLTEEEENTLNSIISELDEIYDRLDDVLTRIIDFDER